MKVAIYCRVSSLDQKENTSLKNQKDLGIKFCESRNYEYEVFEEVVSGSKLGSDRNVFIEIEKRIFDKEFDGLWLYDWDRMVRDVEVMIYFKNLVADTNIKLFVGFEEKNILDGSGELEFEIGSVFSGYWKRKFLRIAKEGRNNRWKEGKGIGKIGFGFDNDKGEVSLNEEEVKVIKDIYKFFLYKNVKKYSDCEDYVVRKYGMDLNGVKLKGGGLAKRVLGNEKYNGKLVYRTRNDGDFEIELDKIIDDDTFNKVNEKLKYVKGIRNINSKEIYILKGKVFCEDCGKSMWIEGSGKIVNGKSYRYYRCSSYKENWKNKLYGRDGVAECKSGKRGNKISKDKLDKIVWSGLFDVLSKSDVVIKEYKKRFDENLGSKDRFISKKGYYNKELKKLEERKTKMISMVLDGKFDEVDYDVWLDNEYYGKKDEINNKIQQLDSEIGKYGYVDKIENWFDLLKEELVRDYNIERLEDKRRFIERYIEKVVVKEIAEVDVEKRFVIGLMIRIGNKECDLDFEYNIKRKSLNLIKEKDFYILKNEFVESNIIVYKNELIVFVKLFVKFNKCGKFDLYINELNSEMIDF